MGKQVKHWLKSFIVIVISLVVVGSVTYAAQLYYDVYSASKNIYHPKAANNLRHTTRSTIKQQRPISILLLGINNSRKVSHSSVPSLTLATLNPQTKTMTLTSLSEKIASSSQKQKVLLGQAYNQKNINLVINLVQNYLKVPVDYYFALNLPGLGRLVDSVGGIKMNYLSLAGQQAPQKTTFDGQKVIRYVAIGATVRQQRQDQVVQALTRKIYQPQTLTNYSELLNSLEDNVQTNITFADLKNLTLHYRGVTQHIKKYQLLSTSSKAAKLQVQQVLKQQLK